MLVYRGMDIGTAKPSSGERGDVPYFGIDCVDAGAPFSTGDWLKCVENGLASSHDPSRNLVVAGGTGLYLKSLLFGLDASASDPAARAKWTELYENEGFDALLASLESNECAKRLLAESDVKNPRRIIRALERAEAGDTPHDITAPVPPRKKIAGLYMPREQLVSRIERRINKMFKAGLVEEAIAVRASSGGLSSTACGAIGYAEALDVADGRSTIADASERIAARTRQLAKRQYTWLRHQLDVEWVEVADGDAPETIAPKVMEVWKKHGLTELSI